MSPSVKHHGKGEAWKKEKLDTNTYWEDALFKSRIRIKEGKIKQIKALEIFSINLWHLYVIIISYNLLRLRSIKDREGT